MTITSAPAQPMGPQGDVGRGNIRLGYLISRYPAISHTFILREVRQLRGSGIDIETASINAPDRSLSEMASDEQEEAESTYYLKKQGLLRGIMAVLRLAVRRPARFLDAFTFAVAVGGASGQRFKTATFYFGEAALLAEWLESRKLNHLHVHFANAAATVALIATRAYPVATFSLTIHGPDEFYEVRQNALSYKASAARFVCCIGSYARSQIMKVSEPSNWSKYYVSPLGVDPAQFHPRSFRQNPGRWEILCVGRLTPAKGQLILLRVLSRLSAEGRSVHCRFVGDGPDRATLVAFAESKLPPGMVTFAGSLNPDGVKECLSEADLFVLPSFAEGIPVSLMEAMSMEVPVIATMVAGIPELIRPGIDGLLVPASDELELAAAITRLMDDEPLRKQLGVAGRQRVLSAYDLANNVTRLGEIMRWELAKS
jgi:glycosyltransferase involved in cell wall biosynthesis